MTQPQYIPGRPDVFWSKVDRNGPVPEYAPDLGPCWIWTGILDRDGYGKYGGDLTHRVTYRLIVGPTTSGLGIDHLCRVRACVNPGHLEQVTSRENSLRGNTLQALNAQKTQCAHGHPFDENNTHRTGLGRRIYRACRACWREASQKYRTRQQEMKGIRP